MEKGKKILFLVTEDAPGMRPYAFSVIMNTSSPQCHAIIVIKKEDDKRHFISLEQYCNLHYFMRPQGKVGKLMWHFYPNGLVSTIHNIINANDIELIVTLTGEVCLSWIFGRLQKKVPILHTVHDAIPHEYKLSPINALKDKIFVSGPNKSILRKGKFFISNSSVQVDWLKSNYPTKRVFYCPFPTLVTPAIETGNSCVPELKGLNDYILFFGRVEFYKGVHVLYNAFRQNKSLLMPHKLVIAGRGDYGKYYFDVEDDDDVIILNRFIEDAEVKSLFEHAALVVYPYLSVTQTGVFSLASRFGKKIVATDLPFFRSIASGNEGVLLTPLNDETKLANNILQSLASSDTTFGLYEANYSYEAFSSFMNNAIEEVLS